METQERNTFIEVRRFDEQRAAVYLGGIRFLLRPWLMRSLAKRLNAAADRLDPEGRSRP